MNACELHQETLSAFLDGAAPPAVALPALDHLLRCAACRDFYDRARALERLLPSPDAEAPAEVWERIVAAAGRRPSRGAVLRRVAPRLAAALLLGVTAWGGYTLGGAQGAPRAGEEVEVLVGGGAMTDARFLELTLEVLRADRRYHDKLYEVLTAVGGDERPGREGAVLSREAEPPRGERREPGFTTANL
jgi:hypothetical protein